LAAAAGSSAENEAAGTHGDASADGDAIASTRGEAAASTREDAVGDEAGDAAGEAPRPARARPERSGDDGSDPIHVAPDEIVDDDSGVPTAIESEDESSGASFDDGPEEPTEPERPPFIARRDPTGLRMTSSHGHDRAETSGELVMPSRQPRPEPRVDHERELVTILPRRITREVPITGADESPGSPEQSVVAEAASVLPSLPPGATPDLPPGELPSLPPPPRYSVAGGVVRSNGPGALVTVLVVLASLMAGMAIYLYVHKHRHQRQAAVLHDAGAREMTVVDAESLTVEIDASERVAVAPIDASVAVPRPDAAVRVAAIDAGVVVPRPDAAVRVAASDAGVVVPRPDAGPDRNKEASRLKDEAAGALADGDTARALELAEQSLQLRRTAQAYLIEARALQRSGRSDDAIAAATSARDLAPGYYMTHHELGMILMSARRNADARPELEKYLELAPNDKDAETVRQLLAAPTP
ncbi:MAG TPA: hypothetical protein VFQ65_26810, partial [Kofleriaceae bacterium]|nr:hypothetical protein [Kofleriaceae bacterium]